MEHPQSEAHPKLLYGKVYPYTIHYSANADREDIRHTYITFFFSFFFTTYYLSRHLNHKSAFAEMLILVSSLSPNNFLSVMTINTDRLLLILQKYNIGECPIKVKDF